jgi:hypothetical protein
MIFVLEALPRSTGPSTDSACRTVIRLADLRIQQQRAGCVRMFAPACVQLQAPGSFNYWRVLPNATSRR